MTAVLLPNFHHEIGGIFPMRELRRVNLRGGGHKAGICLVFDAQMNASSLGERERLKRPECALAEDGIDVSHHGPIITSRPAIVNDVAKGPTAMSCSNPDKF